jgi:hypothetical protein
MRPGTVMDVNFKAIRERSDGPAAREFMCGICGETFLDYKTAARSCGSLPETVYQALGLPLPENQQELEAAASTLHHGAVLRISGGFEEERLRDPSCIPLPETPKQTSRANGPHNKLAQR